MFGAAGARRGEKAGERGGGEEWQIGKRLAVSNEVGITEGDLFNLFFY